MNKKVILVERQEVRAKIHFGFIHAQLFSDMVAVHVDRVLGTVHQLDDFFCGTTFFDMVGHLDFCWRKAELAKITQKR